jgi:opacity protein-like surface antigen
LLDRLAGATMAASPIGLSRKADNHKPTQRQEELFNTMKTRSCSGKIALALAVVLVSLGSATAEDLKIFTDMDFSVAGKTNGVYLSGDAGLSIMQNMTGPVGVIQYHVGPRVDASVGYNITQNIAAELQAGFAFNSWSSLDNRSVPAAITSDVWAVPVIVSGIYKYPFNDHWQAYGGLGAGVLFSTLDISTPVQSSTSTDCTFGYQAMLGIKCVFDEHLECGLGYSFLGSLDHHWNDLGRGITTSPTYMHSVLVSLTYRF